MYLYSILLSKTSLSHLNKLKVCHDFKDGTNSMCDCGSATEATLRFLLQCQQYGTMKLGLLNNVYNLYSKIRNSSNDKCLHLFLYESELYNFETNREVIKLTIKFLKSSKRFQRPLFRQVPSQPLAPSISAKKPNYFFLKF